MKTSTLAERCIHVNWLLCFAGTVLRSSRSRSLLKVRSAAAEAVKVYEKEHKVGKSHKLKVKHLHQWHLCIFACSLVA